MNKFLFNEIEKRMTGLQLVRITRTCNMLELGFAALDSLNAAREQEVFHVQAPFRIIENNTVITTDLDIYYPSDSKNENFKYYEDTTGAIFDMVVKQLSIPNHVFVVDNIQFSEFGDVQIKMSEGNDTLEVSFFNDAQPDDDDECWRFFLWRRPKNLHEFRYTLEPEEAHIVCYSNEVKK